MPKGLSRQYLVEQALELVDEEGLAALSMRKLAARLGVDPMAAYRHIRGKEDLLDGVVEAAVREINLTVVGKDWQDRLRQGYRRLWDGLLAHPNVLPLLSQRTWVTGPSLAVVEAGLGLLREAGVPAGQAVLMANSSALFLISLASAAAAMTPDRAARDAELLGALDPETFPHLADVTRAGDAASYEDMFEWWCDVMIAHVKAVS